MNYRIADIVEYIESKGYSFYSSGVFNLNIIGVRTSDKMNNLFDDELWLIYKNEAGEQCFNRFSITTQPGKYWMQAKLGHPDGTFILALGQYKGAYQIGLHKGKYEALVQRGRVYGYRDNNKNKLYDMDPDTIVDGFFGINIHRSNPYTASKLVDRWSAGCQVFADPIEYEDFMDRVRTAAALWGNSFTYTLIDKHDIDTFIRAKNKKRSLVNRLASISMPGWWSRLSHWAYKLHSATFKQRSNPRGFIKERQRDIHAAKAYSAPRQRNKKSGEQTTGGQG